MPATEPKRQSLYDLAYDLLAWDALVIEAEGEITPILDEFERELVTKLATKADAIGGFVKHLLVEQGAIDGQARATKDELQRLQAKSTAIDTRIDRMKSLIDLALTMTEKTEFAGTFFTLKRVGNGGKQPLELLVGESAVPDRFFEIRTEAVLNKERLREALDAGDPEAMAVARLLPRATRITIK